ncbi:hypothetical protein FA048_04885 [Pedobacter polaris]|uniref:Uncharacterized protein n=1 Tax=Pedobacter polaris TaxID=2571273 RepID=A0A4U1CW57_9SPHI|nr:hypothetical protein [Pedobacter polaris]TKC12956.1 hypothetical protein FA048_04885 [Pedobacter polaris]
MKKRHLHIQQILTIAMLWVFALAITPWNAIHHHEEIEVSIVEKHCTHKLHLKTEQETCLICKAHFEKNYTINKATFITYLNSKLMFVNEPIVTSSYAELISTSLRGPPVFS